MRSAITEGGLDRLDAVIQAIRDTGALEYSRTQARRETQAACAALDRLPNSKYRDYLLELADFAVTRDH